MLSNINTINSDVKQLLWEWDKTPFLLVDLLEGDLNAILQVTKKALEKDLNRIPTLEIYISKWLESSQEDQVQEGKIREIIRKAFGILIFEHREVELFKNSLFVRQLSLIPKENYVFLWTEQF